MNTNGILGDLDEAFSIFYTLYLHNFFEISVFSSFWYPLKLLLEENKKSI